MRKNVKKAFTLAEVLVVLAILGVIAALTMPSLLQSATNAKRLAAFKIGYTTLKNMSDASRIDGSWAGAMEDANSLQAFLNANIEGAEAIKGKNYEGTEETWIQGDNGIGYRVDKITDGIATIQIDTDGVRNGLGLVNDACYKNEEDTTETGLYPRCKWRDRFQVYADRQGIIRPITCDVQNSTRSVHGKDVNLKGYGMAYQIIYGTVSEKELNDAKCGSPTGS